MTIIVLGFVSGMAASAVVVWWFSAWTYMPSIIFGAILAGYLASYERKRGADWKVIALKAAAFIGASILSYAAAIDATKWILGTNGFASFNSYAASGAEAALFVGSFVGSCEGTVILAVALRTLFLKFDFVRGVLLFTMCSAAFGSIVVVGFETFGILPQLIFPVWNTGIAGMVEYLRRKSAVEAEGAVAA